MSSNANRTKIRRKTLKGKLQDVPLSRELHSAVPPLQTHGSGKTLAALRAVFFPYKL
jgi:hypothetical protein